MTTIWTCVALTALASFAIKAAGPAIPGSRPLPPRATGIIALLAPALLAGLVTAGILGPGWSTADGPLALGVLPAAASRTTRLPAPACIILAVAVTAAARAAL
jgi:hypothetical protein